MNISPINSFMERKMNLKNRVFGRLKVLSQAESRITKSGNILTRWLCRCSCGNKKIVLAGSLLQSKTKSCGCLLREHSRDLGFLNKKHGGYSKLSLPQDRVKYQALVNIRERSRHNGYDSDLELTDMPELTEICPVLGVQPFYRRIT